VRVACSLFLYFLLEKVGGASRGKKRKADVCEGLHIHEHQIQTTPRCSPLCYPYQLSGVEISRKEVGWAAVQSKEACPGTPRHRSGYSGGRWRASDTHQGGRPGRASSAGGTGRHMHLGCPPAA